MRNNFVKSGTRYLVREIDKCETEKDFERFMEEYEKPSFEWSKYIYENLIKRNLSIKDVRKALEITKKEEAEEILEKLPSRVKMLRLAALMGLTVEETDEILVRFGQAGLYAKNPKDIIWIYMLNKGGSKTPCRDFKEYESEFYDAIKGKNDTVEDISSRLVVQDVATRLVKEELKDVSNNQEFRRFVQQTMADIEGGRDKFLNYIDILIRKNGPTAHAVFKNSNFLNKYYYLPSQISETHGFPDRTFIIALGLNLNLTVHGINKILSMAYMSLLCSGENTESSKLESCIYYYLKECLKKFPCDEKEIMFKTDDNSNYIEADSEKFYTPREYVKNRLENGCIECNADEKKELLELI